MVKATDCTRAIEADATIKDATKRKHLLTLHAMAADRGIADDEWERLFDGAAEYIAAKYPNPNTAKNKHETLVKLWRVCKPMQAVIPEKVFESIHERMAQSADAADAAFESGKNTKLTNKGILTWEDICDAEKRLFANHYGTPDQVYLSLVVHVYVPRNEPRLIRIAKDAEDADVRFPDENVILLNDGKLVLNDYKTAETYKTITYDVPKRVISSVRAMLSKRDADAAWSSTYPSSSKATKAPEQPAHQTYLFVQERRSEPYQTSAAFSQWVARVSERHLGKKYTANEFRHIYASSLGLHASKDELREAARRMQHSIAKHLDYRVDAVVEKEQDKSDEEQIRAMLKRLGAEEFMRLYRRVKGQLKLENAQSTD
jgi:hypothetical protein